MRRQLDAQQEAQRQSVAQWQLEAQQQDARRQLEEVWQQTEAEWLDEQHVNAHQQHHH